MVQSQHTRWSSFFKDYNPTCRLIFAWLTNQYEENLNKKILVETFLSALESWNVSDDSEANNERWNILDNEENLIQFFALQNVKIKITMLPEELSTGKYSKEFTYGFMIISPNIGHAGNDIKTRREAIAIAIDRAMDITNKLILTR